MSSLGCFGYILTILAAAGAVLLGTGPQTARPVELIQVPTSPTTVPDIFLTQIVFEAADPDDPGVTDENTRETLEVILSRLRALSLRGILNPDQMTGSWSGSRITLWLTDAEVPTGVLSALIVPGYVELVDVSSIEGSALASLVGQTINTTGVSAPGDEGSGPAEGIVFPTIIDHIDIVSAQAEMSTNSPNNWIVVIDLTETGAARLGEFSQAHIGDGLAIVLDGEVLSVPIMQTRVETPIWLTGNFSQEAATVLAAQLSTDPLPYRLQIVSIGPVPE